MTGSSDFLAWAIGSGANVESQAAYAADANLTNGFIANETAPSPTCNKVWRQASSMAAMLGQFIANSGQNAADNGNITELVTQFVAALTTLIESVLATTPLFVLGTGTTNSSGIAPITFSTPFPTGVVPTVLIQTNTNTVPPPIYDNPWWVVPASSINNTGFTVYGTISNPGGTGNIGVANNVPFQYIAVYIP